MQDRINANILEQQNNYYEKQIELLNATMVQIRGIRHDMRNHIYAMKSYAHKQLWNQLSAYLDRMDEEVSESGQLIQTGNASIDSILSFKIIEAQKQGITLKKEIHIPDNLKIDNFDITIILGNLLDNAIEAVEKNDKNNKWIELLMEERNGVFELIIRNPYSGQLTTDRHMLLSKKKEKEKHGYGISNVKKVIERHDGNINIRTADNIFCVNVKIIE